MSNNQICGTWNNVLSTVKIKLISDVNDTDDLFRVETYPHGSPYEATKTEVEDLVKQIKTV